MFINKLEVLTVRVLAICFSSAGEVCSGYQKEYAGEREGESLLEQKKNENGRSTFYGTELMH